MPGLRDLLARMMAPGAQQQPLSFEELLRAGARRPRCRRSALERHAAAARCSSAYGSPPAGSGAAAPDPMETGCSPGTDAARSDPSQRRCRRRARKTSRYWRTAPPATQRHARHRHPAADALPQGAVEPTRLPLGVVTPTPPQVPTPAPSRGTLTEYGSANRGAQGTVRKTKKRHRQFALVPTDGAGPRLTPCQRPAAPPRPGRPDVQEPEEQDPYDTSAVDKKYWLACMEDAERAERPWRERGREIIQIYRNETRNARTGKLSAGPVTFNILFANTEVMLPAVYQKPPTPVVRSRFTKVAEPVPPPMPPMMMPGGPPPMPGPPLGLGGPPPPPEMGGLVLVPPMQPPGGGEPPSRASRWCASDHAAQWRSPRRASCWRHPARLAVGGLPPAPADDAARCRLRRSPVAAMGAPGRPAQADIETAASVMEKALEIVVEDEHSDEAIKMAIKDTLLPGRGVCRVRWKPEMATMPMADPVLGGNLSLPGAPPPTGMSAADRRNQSLGDGRRRIRLLGGPAGRPGARRQRYGLGGVPASVHQGGLETEFAGSEQYEALKTANSSAKSCAGPTRAPPKARSAAAPR